jgi:hypothetical protein
MRRITRWLCFLLLLFPSFARAQDATATSAPWPPDPKQLFAEGVEILKTEILPPSRSYFTAPAYDNEKRVVRVYDEQSDTWKEYGYPPEIDENGFDGYILPFDSDHLLLSTNLNRGEYGGFPDPTGQWLLNIHTGEFTRAPVVCDELRTQSDRNWTLYKQNNQVFICNTKDGQLLGPLPTMQDQFTSASMSKDNERAILFTFGGDVYSYEFSSKKLLKLGNVSGEDRDAGWINDHQVFIRSTDAMRDMGFPWINYYLADATQENSLEGVTYVFKPAEITSRENPRRYEWVAYGDDECFLKELNWETGVIRALKLDVCDIGQVINDGSNDRLYYQLLGRIGDDGIWYPYTAELVRFNPFTGYRQDLLKGEIEWVENISPDGKYAVVLLDDDGCFEAHPRADRDARLPPCTPQKASSPRHVIIDLKTGQQIYERPTRWYDTGQDQWHDYVTLDEAELSTINAADIMSAGPVDSLFNIGGSLFVYARDIGYNGYDETFEFHLLDFGSSPASEFLIGEATKLRYLPEIQQFLVYLPEKRGSADLYDIASHTRYPFITDTHDAYSFEVERADNDTITLVFRSRNANLIGGQLDSVERIRYTIRLPSGN